MKHLSSLLFPGPAHPFAIRDGHDEYQVAAATCGLYDGGEACLLDSLHTYLDRDWQLVATDDAANDGAHKKLLDAGCRVACSPEKPYLQRNDLHCGTPSRPSRIRLRREAVQG